MGGGPCPYGGMGGVAWVGGQSSMAPYSTPGGNAARHKGRFKECRSLEELARMVQQEERGAMDPGQVSAAWWALAKMATRKGMGGVRQVVAALQDRTRDVLLQAEAGGKQLAAAMHSMAKLHTIGEEVGVLLYSQKVLEP